MQVVKFNFQIFPKLFSCILVLPFVILIRLIRPWCLVRWGSLVGDRIGHFAANTELYLCEQDVGINVPKQRYVDLFYIGGNSICNYQLATMWKRVLRIWPSWFLASVSRLNGLVPGGAIHNIGDNTQHDRDVHNLTDRFPPHLQFTSEEEIRGEFGLRNMGIPSGAKFICLNVRDSAYLENHQPSHDWSYHNYRDSNIQNYVLAAEELASRGYYIIRMGAKVKNAMNASHSRVIDYATNGSRSEFMDIYLGAKCDFCISTSSGFEAIPLIFRRPIVFVNMVPFGYLFTFCRKFLGITRHHFSVRENRILTLSEIFGQGLCFSTHVSTYESKGIKLIENTPEEIRDVVIEMVERLDGTWQEHKDDKTFQHKFWDIFLDGAKAMDGKPLHGEIRALFGADFLRNNRDWVQ